MTRYSTTPESSVRLGSNLDQDRIAYSSVSETESDGTIGTHTFEDQSKNVDLAVAKVDSSARFS